MSPHDQEVVQVAVPAEALRKLRHDLRTPLNQIIGYAEMLGDTAEDLGQPDFAADLQRIVRAGWRMLQEVDALAAMLAGKPAGAITSAADAEPRTAQAAPSRTNAVATSAPVAPTTARAGGRGGAKPAADPCGAGHPVALSGFERIGSDLQRALGAGNSFVLDTAPPRAESTLAALPTSPHHKPRLLVVDDNAQNLEMLARRLVQRDYHVQVAPDGELALTLAAAQRFDLVLLDVMMPGISGIEVLTTLRESFDRSELPVIMATALDDSADVVEALRLGANDYVTKPLDFEVALARIETQLALKSARDQVVDLNHRLDAAQDQIVRLADSANIAAWAGPIGDELCRMIGARSAQLWLAESGELKHVGDDHNEPPPWDLVQELSRRGGHRLLGSRALFAVGGQTGRMVGVLVIAGERVRWRDHEIELVSRFARQFGSALELKNMRAELAEAARRQQASRQELRKQGIALARICPRCGRCFFEKHQTCQDCGLVLDSSRVLPFCVASRYQLDRIIGEGGMATVFAATDLRLSRDVAVKFIRPDVFEDASNRQRFGAEARAIARIDHPNVISVYDSGEVQDGSLYMVTELLRGQELGALIDQHGRGTPRQVAHLLRQAADGLAAAHRAGLVHRDVKPANMFVLPRLRVGDRREGSSRPPKDTGAPRFDVKVLDFSIAKDVGCDTQMTQPGHLIGTPVYMSPEQLTQRPIDPRTDTYSLAAVTFLALTGRRTTLANELLNIVVDVAQGQVPPVSSLLRGVPTEVDAGFVAALAKEPAERPPDLQTWAHALADHIERIPCTVHGWPLD